MLSLSVAFKTRPAEHGFCRISGVFPFRLIVFPFLFLGSVPVVCRREIGPALSSQFGKGDAPPVDSCHSGIMGRERVEMSSRGSAAPWGVRRGSCSSSVVAGRVSSLGERIGYSVFDDLSRVWRAERGDPMSKSK